MTTKASFKLSNMSPSISRSGADLARLILNLPPVKAAMIAASEFSKSPIWAERAQSSAQSWLAMNSGQHSTIVVVVVLIVVVDVVVVEDVVDAALVEEGLEEGELPGG